MSDRDVVDRLAIQDLIARYPLVVDGGDFDRLAELCTPDARLDFTAFGGPAGTVPEIVDFLREALGVFRRTQHMMGLPAITLHGDRATARTPCNNPMLVDNPDGTTSVWLIGLWYDDELARTPEGWRFARRVQQRCYFLTDHVDASPR